MYSGVNPVITQRLRDQKRAERHLLRASTHYRWNLSHDS